MFTRETLRTPRSMRLRSLHREDTSTVEEPASRGMRASAKLGHSAPRELCAAADHTFTYSATLALFCSALDIWLSVADIRPTYLFKSGYRSSDWISNEKTRIATVIDSRTCVAYFHSTCRLIDTDP